MVLPIKLLLYKLVLVNTVISNSIYLHTFDDYDDYNEYIMRTHKEAVAKPSIIKCFNSQGICIQSRACPWNKIISDDNNNVCMEHGNNVVCCQVARVRMPIDMFQELLLDIPFYEEGHTYMPLRPKGEKQKLYISSI